jgi:GTPase KRas protein
MIEVVLTTGQEEYVALNDILIRDGEAFMLVYSISSRSSFASIRRFHAQVMRVKESQTDSCSFICLVGNKFDKVTEREVSTEEGLALAKELECEFFEVSSKDGVNVEASFYGLVRAMRKQRTTVPKKPDSPRILREAAVLSQDQRRYHLWNRISSKFHFLTGLFRSRKPHRA